MGGAGGGGEDCFSDRWASFLSDGVPDGGASVLVGVWSGVLCSIADVIENKQVTMAKLGGKTLLSKNAGDVTGTSSNTEE